MPRRSKGDSRRPRQEQIIATVTALADDLGIVFDPAKNKVEFLGSRVEFVQQQVLYQRASGKEKILSVVPGATNGGHLGTYDQLKRNFDFLFAVDTNTTIIKGSRVSFCVSYWVPQPLGVYGPAVPFSGFFVFEINEVSPQVNPECVGWYLIIREIAKNPLCSRAKRIGVVVDSELGLIKQMNMREIPFFANEVLPESVQLIYASADADSGVLPNRMIAYCDRLAKRTAAHFRDNDIQLNKRRNGGSLFMGYRRITLQTPKE
jgi:hypothetical protein